MDEGEALNGLGDQAVELTGDLEVARQPGEGGDLAQLASPPQRGLHPRQQFVGIERFGDVVVRAPAQTLHLVRRGPLGRQHDDAGRGRGHVLAERLTHL